MCVWYNPNSLILIMLLSLKFAKIILWRIDPLLRIDYVKSDFARQRRGKHASTAI
jgi:hypothetical protein